MPKRNALSNGGKTFHTSGVSEADKAMWKEKPPVDGTIGGRALLLNAIEEPLSSQKYTFQRGLAKAALGLPESERLMILAEALAAMGLLERVWPRVREEERSG